MLASYIKALLHKNAIHWNKNGSVGYEKDMGDGVTITYSFFDKRPSYLNGDRNKKAFRNFTSFSDEQKEDLRLGLEHYEEIANITFTEAISGGTLRFGYADTYYDWNGDGTIEDNERAGALARRPPHGLVVMNRGVNSHRADFSPGTGRYTTWLHELGHAVGGFNDVTVALNTDGEFTESHELRNKGIDGQTLSSWQDNHQYTVMSYNGHPDMLGVQPRTLMLYDIAALQTLYGANWNHNSGSNTYSWSQNETFVETIWDGGGFDTFDASKQTRRSIIDLRAGHFSSIGSLNNTSDALNNLAIAYGVTIERAIGGSGGDTITGNSARNFLFGNAGNDTLSGGGGDDYLDGGAGIDTVDYQYWNGGGTYNLGSGIASFAGFYSEEILNFENIQTGAGNDTITGSAVANRIEAGAGNDTLKSGKGSDYINGTSYLAQGVGERDILHSGDWNDRDIFVLGERVNNSGRVFYNDYGNTDYALISDFDLHDFVGDIADRIQLIGSSSYYSISNVSINGVVGAGISFFGDLIGVVQNQSASSLNLSNSEQFVYV